MTAQQSSERNALEKAALMIKQLKDKLEQQERLYNAPIAVVGMACRFPGNMNSAEAFWKGLTEGIDTVGELPVERWEHTGKEKLYGSFLEDIEGFDAAFFGISPREAKAMDPQQRLLLETSWHALEDAGIIPSLLKGTQTGVFVGAMSHDYSEWSYEEGLIDVYTGTGTSNSILAGRLSHYYDWNGPAMTIDTACSSSLVAIHQAVRSLRTGESDTCLVAGVNAILSPSLYNIEIVNQMLSPDGRCKTFDEKANGFARGEGAGVVILKRLDDAIKNEDRIYCIIKGSAVNHDGKSTGLMAPSQSAQEKLLHAALKDAKLQPGSVDFVECHGTGTTLGDPVEVGALQDVYGKGRQLPLYIGAVKSNMGHLEGAAGMAGFMKMALSAYHAAIPPNVHFNTINPYIDNRNVIVPVENVEWGKDERAGGISSFGFSGTNAHVIIQSYKDAAQSDDGELYKPYAFSASSTNALGDYIDLYGQATHNSAEAYTLSCRREYLPYRQLFFSESDISQNISTIKSAEWVRSKPKIVFLFSGQGSQYVDMGALLYKYHPVFRKYFDECNHIYKQITGQDLWVYISGDKTAALNDTSVTQPVLFALSYATACTWREHGVEPDALIGHSIGEWSAACFAGMVSLQDAMSLVVERGRLMEATNEGVMYAVAAVYEDVHEKIASYGVDIAAINAPQQVVISGSRESVKPCIEYFETQGVKCRQFNVKRAFHSRLMNAAADAFTEVVKNIAFKASKYPVYNNIDGALLTPALIQDGYWSKQIITAVNYRKGIETIQQGSLLIETGPGNTLIQLAQRTRDGFAGGVPGLSTPSYPDAFYRSIKTVFEKGLHLDFKPFFSKTYKPVSLPPYAFERTPYWIKNEIKTHLVKGKKEKNTSLPGLYRREWISVERKVPANNAAKRNIVHFNVIEDASQTEKLLVKFSQTLIDSIKSNEPVVIVADLSNVRAGHKYILGMGLLACLQSAMLEHQGKFYGMLLKMDGSTIAEDTLQAYFENPAALMVERNVVKELRWQKGMQRGKGLNISSDKTYIIYGGSGTVGLEIAKYLAGKKAGNIILTGRRNYEVLDIQYQYTIDKLKGQGINIRYQTVQNPATELNDLLKNDNKLGGVFHAAGSYTNLAVNSYGTGLLNGVLKPKVDDTLSLFEFCKSNNADFLLNCSSAVTFTGAPMLGHYAFANAFMDALSEQEKGLDVYSVAWGGWKGSNMLSDGNNEAFQQKWGFHATDAGNMINIFDVLSPGCTAAVDIDWDTFFTTAHSMKTYAPLMLFPNNKMAGTIAPEHSASRTWTRKEINETVYKTTAGILQAEGTRLEFALPFDELGFNSLLALELSTALNETFGLTLSATVVYEHTTPEKLAKYIAGQLIKETTIPETSPGNTNKILAEESIDDLSLEDLKSLLDKKINN